MTLNWPIKSSRFSTPRNTSLIALLELAIRERDIENYFVECVEAAGGFVRKLRWIGRSNAPDRLAVIPGLGAWLIELKRPGKQPTAAQAREIKRINAAGGKALYLSTFEEVDQFMSGLKVDIYV